MNTKNFLDSYKIQRSFRGNGPWEHVEEFSNPEKALTVFRRMQMDQDYAWRLIKTAVMEEAEYEG